LLFVDIIATLGGVLVALWLWTLRADRSFSKAYLVSQAHWFLILGLFWFVVAVINDFYSLETTVNLRATLYALLRISALLLVVYLAIYFFSPPQRLPRAVVLFFSFSSFLLVGLWRTLYFLIFSRTPFRQRALIVGAGWAGQTIAQILKENLDSTYELVGFVDDDLRKQEPLIEAPPVLGNRRDLIPLVKERDISALILAITHEIHDELFKALMGCLERGVEIIPMPLLYEELTGRVPVQHIGDNWYVAMPLNHQGAGVLYPALKRVMDILLASLGLFLLGLALPFIALAIYLDSPGPIFYTQKRVGKMGKIFQTYKFRSMVPEAEKEGKALWAEKRDPRVTRVGRLLRATHVDEFPQFLNILKGEMSVVGPRAERPEFVADLETEIPFYRIRHSIKPGMAGWALVRQGYGASKEDAAIKLEYDLYYIKHQSLWLDLVILLKTIVDTLTFRGR
jgi:exopolysaccharide biosynthesis polyprenyl glycosylphosphotransferase